MTQGSIDVLHEDAHLLFVNKPARMLTVPAPKGEAKNKGRALSDRLADEGRVIYPVHRLDFETSGVVVFAKDEATLAATVELFRLRQTEKTYAALVQGRPRPAAGTIDVPIRDLGAAAVISPKGDRAITRYATLRTLDRCTLLKVVIETGRHNQIRIHFAHLGHPLVGERKYAVGRDASSRASRVMLHAKTLAFTPPHLDHLLRINAPLPQDFETAIMLASEADPDAGPATIERPLSRSAPPPDRRRTENGRGGSRHFRGQRRR